MVVAVSADQPGEAFPRVATAQVPLHFPTHEARKASVCPLDNRLELRKSVAYEAMQHIAGGIAAFDGDPSPIPSTRTDETSNGYTGTRSNATRATGGPECA